MAISDNITNREFYKFTECGVGDVAVRVKVCDDNIDQFGLHKGSILTGEANSIGASTETTLLTKTVAAGTSLYIGNIGATGTSDGIYKLKLNASRIAERRTNWCERNAKFDYSFLQLDAGDVITLTVTHTEVDPQDFIAELIFIEVNL
jgi:hypothetical protein